MTQSDIPEDSPQPDQGGETVDMRGSQGPIYKPRGPVTQHFGDQISITVSTESRHAEQPMTPDAIARHHAALQSLVNRRYALLNPRLPDEGPYRARLRLRINLDSEELKAIVWT